VPTADLPSATPVGPRGYLSDTALAADGIRDFQATLQGMAPEVTQTDLRTAAPGLRQDADRVALAYRRLAAQRLDDTRLEAQRQKVTSALSDVSGLMERMADLAETGGVAGLVALTPQLRAAIDALRAAAV